MRAVEVAELQRDRQGLIAAAPPLVPPRAWFEVPEPEDVSEGAWTVTADGQVYGFAALWDSCHTGKPGRCVQPPKSASGYGYYMTGLTEVDDGELVPTGRITLGTGHASLTASPAATAEHYDNTGAVAADVRITDGKHGIWVSGALRPDLTPERARTLRGASLSGDWRNIRGKLEMLGLLAVNVPGFPVPRAMHASGEVEGHEEVLALIAAGVIEGAILTPEEATEEVSDEEWDAAFAELVQVMSHSEDALPEKDAVTAALESMSAAAFDESKHARHKKGSDKGGQFAPKGATEGSDLPSGQERDRAKITSDSSFKEAVSALKERYVEAYTDSRNAGNDHAAAMSEAAEVESDFELQEFFAEDEVAELMGADPLDESPDALYDLYEMVTQEAELDKLGESMLRDDEGPMPPADDIDRQYDEARRKVEARLDGGLFTKAEADERLALLRKQYTRQKRGTQASAEPEDELTADGKISKQAKIAKVMREFKAGKLKTADGKKVTSRKQALAIAFSGLKADAEPDDGLEAEDVALIAAALDLADEQVLQEVIAGEPGSHRTGESQLELPDVTVTVDEMPVVIEATAEDIDRIKLVDLPAAKGEPAPKPDAEVPAAALTASMRAEAVEKGEANPDGSVVLRAAYDLPAAITAAATDEELRTWVTVRAQELGLVPDLPATWDVEGLLAAGKFEESKHPRKKKGEKDGGQFTVKGVRDRAPFVSKGELVWPSGETVSKFDRTSKSQDDFADKSLEATDRLVSRRREIDRQLREDDNIHLVYDSLIAERKKIEKALADKARSPAAVERRGLKADAGEGADTPLAEAALTAAFEESKHPRHGKGRSDGGKFAPKSGDGGETEPGGGRRISDIAVGEKEGFKDADGKKWWVDRVKHGGDGGDVWRVWPSGGQRNQAVSLGRTPEAAAKALNKHLGTTQESYSQAFKKKQGTAGAPSSGLRADAEPALTAAFDERLHPRHPDGKTEGGQFAPKGKSASWAKRDEARAGQRKDIANRVREAKEAVAEAAKDTVEAKKPQLRPDEMDPEVLKRMKAEGWKHDAVWGWVDPETVAARKAGSDKQAAEQTDYKDNSVESRKESAAKAEAKAVKVKAEAAAYRARIAAEAERKAKDAAARKRRAVTASADTLEAVNDTLSAAGTFDSSKHPRHPKGVREGGRFRELQQRIAELEDERRYTRDEAKLAPNQAAQKESLAHEQRLKKEIDVAKEELDKLEDDLGGKLPGVSPGDTFQVQIKSGYAESGYTAKVLDGPHPKPDTFYGSPNDGRYWRVELDRQPLFHDGTRSAKVTMMHEDQLRKATRGKK